MTGAPRWDQEKGPEQVLRRRGAALRCRGLPGWRVAIDVPVPVPVGVPPPPTSVASLVAKAVLPAVLAMRWRPTIGEGGGNADATGSRERWKPSAFADNPSLPA